MNALEFDQMEVLVGGRVSIEVCDSRDVWAHALRIIPGVGSFCLGVAIGNWLYS